MLLHPLPDPESITQLNNNHQPDTIIGQSHQAPLTFLSSLTSASTQAASAPFPVDCHDSDDSDEGSNFRLKLNRFSYSSDSLSRSSSRASRPPAPVRTYSSRSNGASTPVSDPPPTNANKSKRSRTKKIYPELGATDSELASLKKCAVCDLAWTVRKSAAQKAIHIQSCAAKKCYDQETVRIRLRRALDESPEPPKAKGKGKVEAVECADSELKTYLEDVVDESTAAKRKGRRPEVKSTIQNFNENFHHQANVIASRARSFLDLTRNRQSSGPVLSSSAVKGGSSVTLRRHENQESEENAEPPLTQILASSSLGVRLGPRSGSRGISGFESISDVEDDNSPPLTQPSKLGASRLAVNGPSISGFIPLSPSKRSNRDSSIISVCPAFHFHYPLRVRRTVDV